jgi:hypothetical protein
MSYKIYKRHPEESEDLYKLRKSFAKNLVSGKAILKLQTILRIKHATFGRMAGPFTAKEKLETIIEMLKKLQGLAQQYGINDELTILKPVKLVKSSDERSAGEWEDDKIPVTKFDPKHIAIRAAIYSSMRQLGCELRDTLDYLGQNDEGSWALNYRSKHEVRYEPFDNSQYILSYLAIELQYLSDNQEYIYLGLDIANMWFNTRMEMNNKKRSIADHVWYATMCIKWKSFSALAIKWGQASKKAVLAGSKLIIVGVSIVAIMVIATLFMLSKKLKGYLADLRAKMQKKRKSPNTIVYRLTTS